MTSIVVFDTLRKCFVAEIPIRIQGYLIIYSITNLQTTITYLIGSWGKKIKQG